MDVIKTVQKEVKAKRKRGNTAVVGDMTIMADALPTLELLLKDNSAAQSIRCSSL